MSRYNGNSSGYDSAHSSTPEVQGWTHTGGNAHSRVDFYERGPVKMVRIYSGSICLGYHVNILAAQDYYPTTGTVKTSMDHPSQVQ
jgi:hypothetical protein